MPIYEYQCCKCGEIFEAFQKINDRPLKHCKFCQGKVERLISQSSFQLKGGGWYLTDYARKSGSSSTTDSANKSTDKSTDKAADKSTDKTADKAAKSSESSTTKAKTD